MSDSRADDCIKEHEQLASTRGVWEGHWREVAERVRPTQNLFQQRIRPDGDKRNEKIFDDTAPLALPKFGAAVISMTIPPTQKYHKLQTGDEALDNDSEVKRYLEQVNDILFKMRYDPRANFQSQSGEVVLDVGAFGTGILFIDDAMPGIRYKSFPLAETYLAEDGHGVVNRLHRKFELTAAQAVGMFGAKNCPEAITKAYEVNKFSKFWFLHCVTPNQEKKHGDKTYRGMEFYSCYVAMENRHTCSEGGFRVFPFATPRFETAPREVYGRSPAMKVLPTIKALNEMKKSIIRGAQMVVNPPIMLTDDGSLQAFSMRPNALNYGYMDANGRPLAAPFNSGARVDIGVDLMDKEREAINDAFFVTLFRILVESPQITATEAMLRAQEKGQLLAPTMGRFQTEFCGNVVAREIDIAAAAGLLPEMPEKLIERGGSIRIHYQSPLNLAQRSAEAVGILNTMQAVTPLAQIKPDVMNVFNVVKMARELAEINGVPERVMNSEDEIAAASEQQAQVA
jgi:hypothetical protein